MSTLIEKSADMEKRYEGGIDTWGNRERKLYQKILKKGVQYCFDECHNDESIICWFDIGAGGGNVWDTIEENIPSGVKLFLKGCDISPVAIEHLQTRGNFRDDVDHEAILVDLEEYDHSEVSILRDRLNHANIVSLIDVAYYFGEKRPWKNTMDEIWESLSAGTVVIVADSLIPYQRRSYFSTKDDCICLHDYTDYTVPVSDEVREDGRKWHRYLKVKIYMKVAKDKEDN